MLVSATLIKEFSYEAMQLLVFKLELSACLHGPGAQLPARETWGNTLSPSSLWEKMQTGSRSQGWTQQTFQYILDEKKMIPL